MAESLSPQSSCPFCAYLDGSQAAVFVSRGKVASVLVNPRQYERGALLVIPNKHSSTLMDVDPESFVAVQLEARRMAHRLVNRFGATGVNVFQNAGAAAGQTVPHYHVHVVPRYLSSDPARRFREADYEPAPVDQLQAVAEALNSPDETLPVHHSGPLYETYPRDRRLWGIMFGLWMLAAFGALARLITAPGVVHDLPRAVPLSLQLAAFFIMSRVMEAQGRRALISGYAASLGLFGLSVLLTF